ncbi:hypothetical protein BOTBODRAFT_166167 [Botryobasidium botryosum FD-172 SS1]|uniref:Tetrahydrofolate dehydrogenase/cyclohydrolase NAD(P)-binding domain-containing protein n=1 Tax=Botryobasidium botryosum (strain FD-172 SS1) TaxID=930990 RepID=A0A067M8V8_BOTB1|nr:hypothetical protein BOTBODRAFT_166167 [Botryobasidium botryosum FD-172 SS1]
MAAPRENKPPVGKLVKAETIAAGFHTDIQRALLPSSGPPRLVGILATNSGPSETYAEFTKRTCEGLGVDFVLKRIGAALKSTEGATGDEPDITVEDAIIEANEDESIDGIMVYYPIFGGSQDHYLQQVVSPYKDVEGLHVKFHYNLYHNIRHIQPASLSLPISKTPAQEASRPSKDDTIPGGMVRSILPCTPLAVVKCLEHTGVYNSVLDYGDRAYGRIVTVINRSEVVGRPLAALLANDGARVYSVDIDSIQEYTKRPSPKLYHPHHVVHPTNKTLQECLAISDVVISAVPSLDYKVKTEWLKEGCVCVNVSSEKNFEKDVREKASIYIPAVGKMTIMMLVRNLLRLCHYQDLLHAQPILESN